MLEPDLLSRDHNDIDKITDQVFAALEVGDHQQGLTRLDYFWARLAMHIRAEHLHLFPALLKAPLPKSANNEKAIGNVESLEGVIKQLRGDHNFFMSELAEAVKMMRTMQDDHDGDPLPLREVKERLERVGRRLITHNDIEESQVYPLVESLLSPDEAAEILRKIKRELDTLPARFVDDARGGQ
jgi:hemerythrin superfamily protein